jgi:SAM-dependent methyltransferase
MLNDSSNGNHANTENSSVATGVPMRVPREVAVACGACGGQERSEFYQAGDVVECRGCGVLYVSPRPTKEAIAAFYSASGHYDHWDSEPGRVAMWQRRVERVRRLVPHGRLLDIGAGQGDFGAAARALYEVEGTEVSSEGQRMARERHGLSIHLGDVCELDLPVGRYDVITLWHVLEHVAEPRSLVARCYELLKPGGVVCIAVPNTDGRLRLTRARLRSKLGRRFDRAIPFPKLELASPTEEIHLTHFTLRSLREIVERSSFQVIQRGLDDYSADDELKARFQHHLHALVQRSLGITFGEAIFVAARKPA